MSKAAAAKAQSDGRARLAPSKPTSAPPSPPPPSPPPPDGVGSVVSPRRAALRVHCADSPGSCFLVAREVLDDGERPHSVGSDNIADSSAQLDRTLPFTPPPPPPYLAGETAVCVEAHCHGWHGPGRPRPSRPPHFLLSMQRLIPSRRLPVPVPPSASPAPRRSAPKGGKSSRGGDGGGGAGSGDTDDDDGDGDGWAVLGRTGTSSSPLPLPGMLRLPMNRWIPVAGIELERCGDATEVAKAAETAEAAADDAAAVGPTSFPRPHPEDVVACRAFVSGHVEAQRERGFAQNTTSPSWWAPPGSPGAGGGAGPASDGLEVAEGTPPRRASFRLASGATDLRGWNRCAGPGATTDGRPRCRVWPSEPPPVPPAPTPAAPLDSIQADAVADLADANANAAADAVRPRHPSSLDPAVDPADPTAPLAALFETPLAQAAALRGMGVTQFKKASPGMVHVPLFTLSSVSLPLLLALFLPPFLPLSHNLRAPLRPPGVPGRRCRQMAPAESL